MNSLRSLSRALSAQRLFLLFNAAFWTGAFLIFAAQASLSGAEGQWNLGLRRTALVLWGCLLTSALHCWLEVRATPFSARLRLAIAGVPLIAGVCTTLFYYAYHIWRPLPNLDPFPLEGVTALGEYFVANYPFHLLLWVSWSGIYLSYNYATALAHRERDLAVVAAQAHRAELMMLRYQLNPHFLFNALNAISGQIMTGHAREADAMLTALARFLRHSLANGDATFVSFAEELQAQRLYLNIEQVRFRDRLKLVFHTDPSLDDARVPAFLLQPIVENAIKHAVARVDRQVELTISARRDGDLVELKVCDDGPAAANSDASGTGTGLNNVRERLRAIYGARAAVEAGARPSGGYAVRILLPLERGRVERVA